jgi:hypothetical protein
MTQLPRVPSGDANLVQWAQTIMRCIEERTLLKSQDIFIEETPNGVRIRTKAQSGQGGSTSNDKPVWL